MKITHFILAILCFGCSYSTLAQKVEITPMGGFNFGGTLNTVRGELKIRNNAEWGLMASYRLNKIANIELSYTGIQTNIEHEVSRGLDEDYGDFMISYFMIGSTKELKPDEKLRPFGNLSFGGVWFDPQSNLYDDEFMFAFSAGVGIKYFLSDRVGIRLQTRLLSPIWGAGVGISCGTGGGCGAGVSSTSLFLSGDVSGGLIIAIE